MTLVFEANGNLAAGLAVAALTALAAVPAPAQEGAETARTIRGERYIPAIWVDPDGCEHWVMDDGAEGYMTPHVTRDGIPVCRSGTACGTLKSDLFFGVDSARLTASSQAELRDFFAAAGAPAFIITGHTDNTASDAYNLSLSKRRAEAVAAVARSAGAQVTEIRGYGERQPRVSNDTAEGRAQNRRVEVICVR